MVKEGHRRGAERANTKREALQRARTLVRNEGGGEVRLFGTPVPRFREWRRVGYVPQRITAAGGVPATVYEVDHPASQL